MNRPGTSFTLILLAVLCPAIAPAQTGKDAAGDGVNYKVRLAVDEVVLTFRATDALGRPVLDLKREEIRIWDNGRAPRRILGFEALTDRALRGAILLDTSESMQPLVIRDQSIATQAVASIFREKSDQGLIGDFAFGSEIAQPWTAEQASLLRGIHSVRPGRMRTMPGTSLFDAIFRTCLGAMGKLDATATGNFLLLFTDGDDNASTTTADEALSACQRSNTAIYAFREPGPGDGDGTGPASLRQLAERSGGRVFDADESADAIRRDLEAVQTEMRNQYRLIFSPAALAHDGSFHTIALQPPDRVRRIDIRSGYYAPGS